MTVEQPNNSLWKSYENSPERRVFRGTAHTFQPQLSPKRFPAILVLLIVGWEIVTCVPLQSGVKDISGQGWERVNDEWRAWERGRR